MTAKLEAVQAALKSYFERFPRISIKGLSARTGVPYATLRRLMQNEVSEIRDETIFKLIDRVMGRSERLDFICEYYPALARILRADDKEKDPGMEALGALPFGLKQRVHVSEQGIQALIFAVRDFERRLRDVGETYPGPIAFFCDFGVTPQVSPEVLRGLPENRELTS